MDINEVYRQFFEALIHIRIPLPAEANTDCSFVRLDDNFKVIERTEYEVE